MTTTRQYARLVSQFLSSKGVSPVDAVALPLALRALTAEKAFSEERHEFRARVSSCQRSASASHFPLFLGSVLARSKHHNSIVLQSLSLIVTPSLTLFFYKFILSPFRQSHFILCEKTLSGADKEPDPYCVQMRMTFGQLVAKPRRFRRLHL